MDASTRPAALTGHARKRRRPTRFFTLLPRLAAMWLLVATSLGQNIAFAQGLNTTVRDLAAPPPAPQFVPGEVIVKLKPTRGAPTRLAPRDLAPLGFRSSPRQTSGGELIYQFSPATMFALRSAQEARERVLAVSRDLSARPDVEYAQPNWVLRPLDTTPDDPGYPFQWHYWNNGSGTGESPGGINLPKAWDSGTGSGAIAVAVIDTGIADGDTVPDGLECDADGDGLNDGLEAGVTAATATPPTPATPRLPTSVIPALIPATTAGTAPMSQGPWAS